jgi:triacylglycerol lipase
MRYIRVILGEIASLFLAMLLFFYNLAKRNPKTHSPGTPIILIHGYLYRSGGWAYLRRQLMLAGHTQIYCINLGLPKSIDEHALQIQKLANEIVEINGSNDLICIGHSMGGIVATQFANHYAEGFNVKKIITLGSPLEGSQFKLSGIGQCTKEMAANSAFVQQMVDFKSSASFLHMASKLDPLIRPWTSALFYKNKADNVERVAF